MRALKNYFRHQLNELRESPALCFYGAALALTHVISGYHWFSWRQAPLPGAPEHLCWPQFPDCASWVISHEHFAELNYLYFLGSVFCVFLFFRNDKTKLAYWLLAALTTVKLFLFIQDYRSMGNYHYITFLMLSCYLFVPRKMEALPILLCLFYFAAGTLKFNREWLEGYALLRPSFVTGAPLRFLLAYAVFFEIVLIWGLLSKNKRLFSFVFAQTIFFHLFSWHIVGYFYPCLMFCLISIFPIAIWKSPGPILQNFFSGRSSRSAYAVAAAFTVAQLPPHFLSADSAVTAEGRIFSVNMLDAKVKCSHYSFARFKDHVEEISDKRNELGPRVQCDPIVYWNLARERCRTLRESRGFLDLDVQLISRRSSEATYHKVIDIENFCAKNPSYSLMGNPWVQYLPAPDQSARFSHVESGNEATSVYRGGSLRNSMARWNVSGPLTTEWRLTNGNIGIHSASKASPAVDETGTYVGGDSSWFFSYDLEGREKWRFRAANSPRGFHSTAALDTTGVYFGAYNGSFYKLNKSTGRVVWAVQLGDAIGASPLLEGNSIYVNVETSTPDGFLAKLDKTTGRILWQSKNYGEQSHSSPALHSESGLLVFGTNNNRIFALKSSNGAVAWWLPIGGPVKSTPLIVKDVAYISSWDKFVYALKVTTGEVLWKTQIGRTQSSPTLIPHSKTIVVGTFREGIVGLDLSSGKMLWRKSTGSFSVKASALALDKGRDGSVLIPCGQNLLCELSAKGKLLQKVPLEAEFDGVPVAHGNTIFLSERAPGGLVKLHSRQIRPRDVSASRPRASKKLAFKYDSAEIPSEKKK